MCRCWVCDSTTLAVNAFSWMNTTNVFTNERHTEADWPTLQRRQKRVQSKKEAMGCANMRKAHGYVQCAFLIWRELSSMHPWAQPHAFAWDQPRWTSHVGNLVEKKCRKTKWPRVRGACLLKRQSTTPIETSNKQDFATSHLRRARGSEARAMNLKAQTLRDKTSHTSMDYAGSSLKNMRND